MQRIQIPAGEPQPAQVDLAADAIAAGRMVVLPTETVYGLAIDPSRSPAVQQVAELKVRPPEQQFTHHLHGIEQLSDLAQTPAPRVHRFLTRFWPGPLTAILRARVDLGSLRPDDGSIGLRVPAHDFTRAVIRKLMDPDEGRWYGAIIDYFGKEAAVKLMQGLGKQDIQWRKGHSLLAQLIVAGEFSLALVYAHRTQAIKKSGAPLDWVKTTKPIVVASNGMAVMKDAPHPAAARLFVDFFLSREAQKLLLDRGHIPLRGDIIPRNSPFYPERLDLHPVAGHVMSRLLKLQKDFSRLMGQ